MRFTSTTTGRADQRLNDGARPPLEAIPTALVKLLIERDAIAVRRAEAQADAAQLAGEHLDHEAKSDDEGAATAAARAGQPLPKASAVERLAKARELAARTVAAQESAHAVVTDEAEALASELYWTTEDERAAILAEAVADIEAASHALADKVDAAVQKVAVAEWIRGAAYQPKAETFDCDVIDLAHLAVSPGDRARVINVRDVILKAATTVLTQER